MTTFFSYGEVQEGRQADIFKGLRQPRKTQSQNTSELAKEIVRELKRQG